jgi:V/A-type H+/Na+-transporting ATPase subunit C
MIREALSYLYVNAKVMAKEGKFLSSHKWDDLWGCASTGEIVSLLEGTDYFPYLSEGSLNDAIELEKAVLEEYSDSGREIANIIPKGAQQLKDFILRKWDIINLRSIMRGIHGGFGKEQIMDSLLEGGEIGSNLLSSLADAEGMEDFVALLENTPYSSLSESMPKYNETKNLYFLESTIDKIYWTYLWQTTVKSNRIKEFKEYIERCVEAQNLKIILRAKSNKMTLEEIHAFLIPECPLLHEILPVFDEENISGIIALLEGTAYFEPLTSVEQEYEDTGSVLFFEDMLDKLVTKKADDIRKKKPFGAGPLIGFLISKDVEIQNLLAVIRATGVDLDRESIRELLMRK